ncbi:uncharacterized protein F4822DRAFT_53413 [Hypoxylon trugodes]|uniref:uncharacterized protein n=1 Tax=Hypoxylon trugodes TaxID=326681 RepID=UPI00219D83A6|nr:uncharacterized protein F4822DRAFT_53413 [Hypoxylon trugodes]KAI1383845.1 hypothetical protein F4822DRAFT_53413 [Hypoxylon trugodes]
MDPAKLQDLANELEVYFSRDSRFVYRQPVAAGGFGSTHRVQYIYANNGMWDVADFLVKVAYDDQEALASMQAERGHLKLLRGGMHIAQILNIADDPLKNSGLQGDWLMLEWLPNGTLEAFIRKARDQGVTRLPNRLLWRFLLCFVRACCGMAWPRNRQDGMLELELPKPGIEPIGFLHNDFHAGNGDFAPGEHAFTPNLKLIDFGNSDVTDEELIDVAKEQNLWDVGKLMMQLISLDLSTKEGPAANPGTVHYLGENIETRANAIFPEDPGAVVPFPWLDNWLRTLIGLFMAVDSERLPDLQSLSSWVPYAVVERTAGFYGLYEESDYTIRELCRRIILDP